MNYKYDAYLYLEEFVKYSNKDKYKKEAEYFPDTIKIEKKDRILQICKKLLFGSHKKRQRFG
jgi:hypothetical protein